MRNARDAFTLIELMISITLLSVIMLFLYKSYATLNRSNANLKVEAQHIKDIQDLKKVVYLDFISSMKNAVTIKNKERNEDFVFFQTVHSLHRRHNPYITYVVREEKLYRLESLHIIKDYDFPSDTEFDVDYLGEVNSFRVYKSKQATPISYLVHIEFKSINNVLLKIKVFNE